MPGLGAGVAQRLRDPGRSGPRLMALSRSVTTSTLEVTGKAWDLPKAIVRFGQLNAELAKARILAL